MDLGNWIIYAAGAMIIVPGMMMTGETNQARQGYENQVPIYEDRNEDGVKDKIVKKIKDNKSPFFMPEHLGLEEEVLYGAKLPNGKTIYLQEDQLGEKKFPSNYRYRPK